MPKKSAGLIMYRIRQDHPEVFLVHPGGPFWKNKDQGAWSIPKGEYLEEEDPLAAAQREFQEETGFTALAPFFELGTIKQPGGKLVTAWAFAGDCDPAAMQSNTFQMEWPPRSGRKQEFSEADQGRWFSIPDAKEHMLQGQQPLLESLQQILNLGL